MISTFLENIAAAEPFDNSINIWLLCKIIRDCRTNKLEILDDFNCPAIDQNRREGRRLHSPKIHNHLFCFVYIERQIVFAAPADKFVISRYFLRILDL